MRWSLSSLKEGVLDMKWTQYSPRIELQSYSMAESSSNLLKYMIMLVGMNEPILVSPGDKVVHAGSRDSEKFQSL